MCKLKKPESSLEGTIIFCYLGDAHYGSYQFLIQQLFNMRAQKFKQKSVCDYDRRVIIIACTCTLSLLKTNFTRRTFFHHLYTNRCSFVQILNFMLLSKYKVDHLHLLCYITCGQLKQKFLINRCRISNDLYSNIVKRLKIYIRFYMYL